MKTAITILSFLLLAGGIAGCSAPDTAGSSKQPNYSLGACSSNSMGAGYSRDYSYGDRYLSGQNRRC